MRCDRVQWLLSAHKDGELSPRLSARVAGHLEGCPACAAEWRALERLVTVLRALPEEAPPTHLRASISAALDTAKPTFWQRWHSALFPLPTRRALAYGTFAVAFLAVELTGVPVLRDELRVAPASRLAYDMPSRPIAARSPGTHPTPQQPESVPAPQPVASSASPALIAEVPRPKSEPAVRLPLPVEQPSRATHATRPLRRPAAKPGARGTAPQAPPTFDPLAPVLEPTGSPNGPVMPNVVMADGPASTAQPDPTTVVASMPSDSDMTTPSTEPDDLDALRRRLAQEQLQIPPVRLDPHPAKPKNLPILRGDF